MYLCACKSYSEVCAERCLGARLLQGAFKSDAQYWSTDM
jgi:hypothetical protein